MPEKYMGTSKAAELWGCSRDYISKLCREGKIKGAEQDGKRKPWRIPVDTPNPFKNIEEGKRDGQNEYSIMGNESQ